MVAPLCPVSVRYRRISNVFILVYPFIANVSCFRSSVMYKGAILNIQKNSNKASSCPDIYNNDSTLTVNSEPDSVSLIFESVYILSLSHLDGSDGKSGKRSEACDFALFVKNTNLTSDTTYLHVYTRSYIYIYTYTRFYRCPADIVLSK